MTTTDDRTQAVQRLSHCRRMCERAASQAWILIVQKVPTAGLVSPGRLTNLHFSAITDRDIQAGRKGSRSAFVTVSPPISAPASDAAAWALQRAGETHSNKVAVTRANKLARIAWAVWHREREFDGNHIVRVAA